ncbi:MAG: cystathionine beta-lyase [Alphaproteobacteria bacterium]
MKDETLITLAGRHPEKHAGAISPPVYHASTILFPTLDAFDNQKDQEFTYGLHGTPGTKAFEEAMNALEGAAATIIVPSGLAAVSVALLAVLKAGDHVLMVDSTYEPTRILCNTILKRFGVETTYYDPLVGSGISAFIRENTRAIFLESPGSRTFEVQDVPAIVAAARARREIVTIMDNTWATPLYFKPLAVGVDLSVQATSKYIAGHSDLLLGTVSANGRTAERLKTARRDLGMSVGPDDVYLAMRGLRTVATRLKQHGETSLILARWLQARPDVERVCHPALPGDPGHEIWKRDFSGTAGVFACVLNACTREQLRAFLEPMKLFKMGWSWGGFESLITPGDPNEQRTATRWKASGPTLRLQVGLEHQDDLIADLNEAFSRLNAAAQS